MTMADYDDIIDYYRNAACMAPMAPVLPKSCRETRFQYFDWWQGERWREREREHKNEHFCVER